MEKEKEDGAPIKYPNGKHPNSHKHYWGAARKYDKPRYVSFFTDEIFFNRLIEEAERRKVPKSVILNNFLKILPKTKAEREENNEI